MKICDKTGVFAAMSPTTDRRYTAPPPDLTRDKRLEIEREPFAHDSLLAPNRRVFGEHDILMSDRTML